MKHGSVPVKGVSAVEGETIPRRSACSPDELVLTPEPDVKTLYDVIMRSARLFPNQNGMGYRNLLHIHEEKKQVTKTVDGKEVTEDKTWMYFEMSDYHYITYSQFAERMRHVGSGLAALGLDRSKHFVNYSQTSYNWQSVAYGCVTQSITFATAYDSLGKEGIQHAITQTEASGLFTNASLLPLLSEVLGETPTIEVLVYDGEIKPDTKEHTALLSIQAIRDQGIKVISIDDLIELGKEKDMPLQLPTPDDVATIMYTSGSMGAPKGVVLTHRNLVSAIAAVKLLLGDILIPGESYMAYLPLAHIMEFVVETCMVYVGVPLGFGSVKTLTDTSCRNCVGDLRAFKPSIMIGVPAVWETIKKGIQSKVVAGGALKSKIFETALSLKRSNKFLFGGLADAIVFNNVKAATGGRLRYALSGGAPLSKETQEFLSLSLLTLIQGYGMTECSAMCAILPPSLHRYESVGVPSPAVEVKLRDVPEANYFATNNPPQGEVLVRGNAVCKGYYKRDDLNEESFTEDGWLVTGDIGQWNSDGTLSLIDRKKNLVKLSNGEYIAIERLESIYKSAVLVANVCVHADTSAKQPMAIIHPHEDNLRIRIKDKSIADPSQDFETLCKDPKVINEVLKDANSKGKSFGFKPQELLQCVVLTSDVWTPQNGLLTAAQKLSRKAIFDRYHDQIKKVYP